MTHHVSKFIFSFLMCLSQTLNAGHELGLKTLKEEHTQAPLIPQNHIPNWLSGSFVTVGPGVFELNNSTANYWLDGFAMAHQFVIDGAHNVITYTNKLINSSYYQDCCKKGKLRGSAPDQKNLPGQNSPQHSVPIGRCMIIPI